MWKAEGVQYCEVFHDVVPAPVRGPGVLVALSRCLKDQRRCNDKETETNGTTPGLASNRRIKEIKKRYERRAARTPAVRLAVRRSQ